MKQIAIIGPTASGKTSLAIEIAKNKNSVILSLDSLSVYKHIDIASAKPTKEEIGEIVHFGLDEVYPDQKFDVAIFCKSYQKAKEYAILNKKNLIIVGGSGFYLKVLIEGISPNVNASQEDYSWVKEKLENLPLGYEFLKSIDQDYAKKIYSNDKYRIEKGLLIYKSSGIIPSQFFAKNPKIPLIDDIDIFEIVWPKDELTERIERRTEQMFDMGVVTEVEFLIKTYGKSQNSFNSIGIKEIISYFDGEYCLESAKNWIKIHTSQLAKKQRTFNKSQFHNKYVGNLKDVEKEIFKNF